MKTRCRTEGHWTHATKDAGEIATAILANPASTETEKQLASCILALVRASNQIPCAT